MNQVAELSRRIGRIALTAFVMTFLAATISCRSERDETAPPPTEVSSPEAAPTVSEPAPSSPEPTVADSEIPILSPPLNSQPPADGADTSDMPKPVEMAPSEPEPTEPVPLRDPYDELDFGEPLVEGLGQNERLDPKEPIWLTKDGKSVVMQAMVCQRQAPLEMFACLLRSKEHESVLAVPVKAFVVHAGLLAAGAESGTPVRWDPEYAPPTGTEIAITVYWKDEQGEVQQARAQEWVRDMTTGKAMAQPWVFAGSRMVEDEQSGKEFYAADTTGDLICVSNFSSATLDVPIRSSQSNASLMFDAFTERIPPLGTPVTMVLTPKLDEPDEPKEAESNAKEDGSGD